VAVPTWRLDVSREIDLIEEIARVHGFNRFENTLPPFSGGVVELPTAEREAKIRNTMLALGFHEALSSSFVSREDAERFARGLRAVELENPLSEERAVMRTSLLPGMLDMLEHNLNRNQDVVRLFEMGNTFRADEHRVVQEQSLCFGVTQPESASDWPRSPFYELKGVLETILRDHEAKTLFSGDAPDTLRPGRAATLTADGKPVARFGEIAASAYGSRKFKQPVYLCEVNLDALFRLSLRTERYTPLSRYPVVERDFSFLVPNSRAWEQVQKAVMGRNVPHLTGFQIMEVFRGKSVPEGQYSALFRATMQSREHTLREEEAALASSEIIAALQAIGGTLRSA
jgi:phenylalanyl-tRNA synthetase beta chain